MKRNIDDVLGSMLKLVPKQETLHAELTRIRRDAGYVAPEVMGQMWRRGAEALSEHFGGEVPRDGWGAQVLNIWMGRD